MKPAIDSRDWQQYSDLRREIETAFGQTAYPGDDGLAPGPLDDNHPSHEWTYETLKGMDWRTLLDDFEQMDEGELNYYYDIFFFMLPQALHYYLPAFLIRTLHDPGGHGGIYSSLLYMLDNEFWALSQAMDQAQKRVVVEYLHYRAAREPHIRNNDLYPRLFPHWESLLEP